MMRSDIPFGAQFSPNQVDLLRLLHIVADEAGDRDAITSLICDEFFASHPKGQQRKLAGNTVLALRAYGLLEDDGATPTLFARELLALDQMPEVLYERFAHHILLNLRGIPFLETLEAMQTAGEKITLNDVGNRLAQRGLHVPRGAVHLSSMRLWLAKAGIFDAVAAAGPRLYEIDRSRLRQVLGIGLDAIDRLTRLSAAQRAFLRALTRMAEAGPFVANKIADLSTALYAAEYNHKELPKAVLFPLRDLGYIEVAKATAGRGAKPYQVSPTAKFYQEISEPILAAAAEKAGLVPAEFFRYPLSQILAELRSPDTHVKGKALELLAIYMAGLIGLSFEGWLLRSNDSKGIEVGVLTRDRYVPPNRWQIQCCNSSSVDMEEIATAVGRSVFIKPHVVLSVATGVFTARARYYAAKATQLTNLRILLMNAQDLKALVTGERTIADILRREAARWPNPMLVYA